MKFYGTKKYANNDVIINKYNIKVKSTKITNNKYNFEKNELIPIVQQYCSDFTKHIKYKILNFCELDNNSHITFLTYNYYRNDLLKAIGYKAKELNLYSNKNFCELYIKLCILPECIIIYSQLLYNLINNFNESTFNEKIQEIINNINKRHPKEIKIYNKYYKEKVNKKNKFYTKYLLNLITQNPIYIIEINNENNELKKIIENFIDSNGIFSFTKNEYENFHTLYLPIIINIVEKNYKKIKFIKDRNTRNNEDFQKVFDFFSILEKFIKITTVCNNYNYNFAELNYKSKKITNKIDYTHDEDYYIGFGLEEEIYFYDYLLFVFYKYLKSLTIDYNPYNKKNYCRNCQANEDEAIELKDKKRKYCYKCAKEIKKEKNRLRQQKKREKDKKNK